jgi:Cd2+/Zn2+-exporting ATPase
MNNPNNLDKTDDPLSTTCSSCSGTTGAAGSPNQHPLPDNVRASYFLIEKMDCPTEEQLIRNKLEGMAGIVRLEFNLMARKLTVQHTLANTAGIVVALNAIDMSPRELDEEQPRRPEKAGPSVPGKTWWLLSISGVSAIAAEITAWTTGIENSPLIVALALTSILAGGLPTLKKGWIAIKNLTLSINFLMSVAVIGAVAIGQWPEAAVVIWLFAVAEMIESLSLDRARNAIRGLMAMTPEIATVLQPDGEWREIEAKRVAVGQTVRVKPGERIPLDGVVIGGSSAVNQAPITGESIPVEKRTGDQVFAGTINETGSLEYRVTAPANDSTLARIIHAVEQAQGSRAPTQRFVDRFARVYTPAVFMIAVLVAVVPPLAFGQPFGEWFYRALVLLVIGCPCALVISTPVTVVSGLAAAARRGILIKGGVYLEEGHKLKALALDKTGTITRGKPKVTDIQALVSSSKKLLAGHPPEGELVRLAASLASRSDHPVSSAVAAYWRETVGDTGNGGLLPVEQFAAIAGRGVSGLIAGVSYYLGNHRLVHELGICSPQIEAALESLERDGKTVVVLCHEREPLIIIGVADTVRETSREAIRDLHALGIRTVMLTGDNPHTAQVIARAVGIDDARGNLLPEDKLAVIDELVAAHGHVGMAGDGINDAPALAKASIGFAMGAAGTDTALETADVALMDDDLRKIPDFIRLSKKTNSVLWQNITFALGIKAIFFVLALAGKATLWMAVFADMGASLIVVFNGLRLLRQASAVGFQRRTT